jgi:hypothetical protein
MVHLHSGRTLHSLFGTGNSDSLKNFSNMRTNPYVKNAVCDMDVLIIVSGWVTAPCSPAAQSPSRAPHSTS